jgi:hypothetical protein
MTTPLTTAELKAAEDALPRLRKPTLEQTYERQSTVYALQKRWAAYLAEKYGSYVPNAFLVVIYEKAYETGHSDGYESVENYYQEYVDFASAAIKSHIEEGYLGYEDDGYTPLGNN